MNSNLENFQGIQQQQVEFLHQHVTEGLEEMADFYKLLTTANQTYLDGLKEVLQIATNPNYSASVAQWPSLLDHNIQRAMKLNHACVETTMAIQARVTKNLEQEIPAYSQQVLDNVKQLTQVLGRSAETLGKGKAGSTATPSQPHQQKTRRH